MDSKTKSSINFNYDHIINYKKIIKQHEYDLELKQQKFNELENLCDKQTIEIEEKILEIEEKDKEIQHLLQLLKLANPELLKIYNGELTPY